MPRVRLPHASPIAPAVFTESLAPTRRRGIQCGRGNGHVGLDHQRHSRPSAALQHAEHASEGCWRQAKPSSPTEAQTHPPRHCSTASLTPPSLRHSYADISAITRQQYRSYATVARPAAKATQPQPPAHDALPEKAKVHPKAVERAKALAIELGRVQSYLSRYAHLTEDQLMERGHYRSLRRRIANLEQWDLEELDLSAGSDHGDWLVQAFAALDRSVFPEVRKLTRKIRIVHRPECEAWCSNLLQGLDGAENSRMWNNWLRNDLFVRESSWKPLLLYLLDRKPSRALPFMQVLVQDLPLRRVLDSAIMADALGHLSKLHLEGRYDTDPGWLDDPVANELEFAPGFHQIYTCIFTKRTHTLSQNLIYNISQFAEIADFKRICDLLFEEKTRFGFDTLLHYANVFAEAGEVEYALRCLDKIREGWRGEGVWEQVVDRQRLRWTCALILRKTASQESGYRATPGLVESFVTMGVKMDLTLYNVVINNAMEAGDYTTAFKLYNSLEEHDLKPDARTLGILLHGCIMQDNPTMFSDFARHVRTVARETQDTWLAAEYLYYVYVRHQDAQDKEDFTMKLWRVYLKIFTPAALEPLISPRRRSLRDRIVRPVLEEGVTLMEPSSMALYVMLQAEIKYAMSLGHQLVQTLYDQFKVVALANKHAGMTELAKQPIIWNAFLLAFCRQEHFASASQVIKDMTDNSPQPNIYSWNIFMQAFFRTGQVQAAERVFEILRSRGVDPDQYTHGVLLRGYAKAQLVDRIGETMQHVDAENEMNPELLRALSRVVDREKMMRVLEESRLAKEAKIKQQAEEEAKEQERRWNMPEFIDPEGEVAALKEIEGGISDEEMEKEIQKMEEQARKLKGRFLDPTIVDTSASRPEPVVEVRRVRTTMGKTANTADGEEWF
ncbi:hypothetical protein NX059_008734 [Plenodomus lindquistii]|nr:hypothetical protein NX059_008734 [Plenodomus lindquistii]